MTAFLFGCKKENSDNNNEEQKISRFEILQSGFSGKAIFSFSFDHLNRVTKFTGHIFYPPYTSVQPSDTIFNMEFEYNSANQLPVKVTQRMTWPGSIFTRTHYLTYDNVNNLRKDSISVVNAVTSNSTVVNYRNNGNAIISEIAAPPNTIPFKDSIVMNNGNIVLYDKRIEWNRHMQITYQFETSLNPLNNLNIAPIFFILTDSRTPENGYFSLWTLCNKNNVTSVKYKYDGSGTNEYFMSYLINTDGTPAKRYWHNTFNSTEIIDTLLYHY